MERRTVAKNHGQWGWDGNIANLLPVESNNPSVPLSSEDSLSSINVTGRERVDVARHYCREVTDVSLAPGDIQAQNIKGGRMGGQSKSDGSPAVSAVSPAPASTSGHRRMHFIFHGGMMTVFDEIRPPFFRPTTLHPPSSSSKKKSSSVV